MASMRVENRRKRRLRCLRCGALFWTDRCHRICSKCYSDYKEPFTKTIFAAEGLSTLGEYRYAEEVDVETFDGVDE